ncbi:chaperonin 10-like protein [Flagelloscypha sp. PMI_526]|nr:chaperonin 10-like protein [Flagelloscypha sp. PMI_526]
MQTAVGTPSKAGGFASFSTTKPTAPSLAATEVLVRIRYSGANHIDAFMAATGSYLETFPHVLGKAWAGKVVAVGVAVTRLQVGDKVTGAGYLPTMGSFQEYIAAPEVYVAKVPERLSLSDAATIPHTYAASFVSLFSQEYGIGLPLPPTTLEEKSQPILVWGGSSSTGIAALQTLGGLGFTSLFTVAGAASHDKLSKLPGVKVVYDRSLPGDQLVADIRKDTEKVGNLKKVYATMVDEAGWDSILGILEGKPQSIVSFIMGSGPNDGKKALVEGRILFRRSVGMYLLKDPIGTGVFSEHLESLLATNAVTPSKPANVFADGDLLERVQSAMKRLQEGHAGESVVVEIV